MTIECTRWQWRLEQAAKEVEGQAKSEAYMAAWRLNRLAGELVARQHVGESPTEAIAHRRDHAKEQAERGDREAKLEYEALARLLPELGKGVGVR